MLISRINHETVSGFQKLKSPPRLGISTPKVYRNIFRKICKINDWPASRTEIIVISTLKYPYDGKYWLFDGLIAGNFQNYLFTRLPGWMARFVTPWLPPVSQNTFPLIKAFGNAIFLSLLPLSTWVNFSIGKHTIFICVTIAKTKEFLQHLVLELHTIFFL